MHVSLSDMLVCPRCGPDWGLILMPDLVRDRRVEAGVLGCPNCRSQYAVRGGIADLTAGREALEKGGAWRPEDGATRLAGLLGLAERRGVVLLAGPAAAHARAVGSLVEGLEVLASPAGAGADRAGGAPDPSGGTVSELELGDVIPVRTGSLHGVALTGSATSLVTEAARVLGPGARLLVDPAGPDARERLAETGVRVVAEEGGALLATR